MNQEEARAADPEATQPACFTFHPLLPFGFGSHKDVQAQNILTGSLSACSILAVCPT